MTAQRGVAGRGGGGDVLFYVLLGRLQCRDVLDHLFLLGSELL
jgi:hypothetical protein